LTHVTHDPVHMWCSFWHKKNPTMSIEMSNRWAFDDVTSIVSIAMIMFFFLFSSPSFFFFLSRNLNWINQNLELSFYLFIFSNYGLYSFDWSLFILICFSISSITIWFDLILYQICPHSFFFLDLVFKFFPSTFYFIYLLSDFNSHYFNCYFLI
jgi:hypothetical protein